MDPKRWEIDLIKEKRKELCAKWPLLHTTSPLGIRLCLLGFASTLPHPTSLLTDTNPAATRVLLPRSPPEAADFFPRRRRPSSPSSSLRSGQIFYLRISSKMVSSPPPLPARSPKLEMRSQLIRSFCSCAASPLPPQDRPRASHGNITAAGFAFVLV
jgi:hypothetical protein